MASEPGHCPGKYLSGVGDALWQRCELHLGQALQKAIHDAGIGRQQQQPVPHTATLSIFLLYACIEPNRCRPLLSPAITRSPSLTAIKAMTY